MSAARKPLLDMVLDAGIIAGLEFFSVLGAAGLLGTDQALLLSLVTAGIAAGGAFFAQLAIARGLKGKA